MKNGILKISKRSFAFYYQMHQNIPNTKILYHFPTQSLMIAKEEYQCKRVIPLIIKKDKDGSIVQIKAENQNEKYIVDLVED